MKEFTCIICPRGCQLKIDDNMNVTGNTCPRGKEYAISEVTDPRRTITTTIRVKNREDTLVSVKTSAPVPKGMIFKVMEEIDALSIDAPCKIGQIAKTNILGLNIDILVTKNID